MYGNYAVTDPQGRMQFSMWAVMNAPLLLSQNVRNLSTYQLQTYTNKAVLAVANDPMGRAGQRLAGGSVSLRHAYPKDGVVLRRTRRGGTAWVRDSDIPVTLQSCASSPLWGSTPVTAQQWVFNATAPGFVSNPASGMCMNMDDCGTGVILYECVTSGGTCCGADCYDNEIFYLNAADNTLRSPLLPGQCLTSFGVGSQVQFQPCTGLVTQTWVYNGAGASTLTDGLGNCLTAGGGNATRAAIWGRPLVDGSWAIVYMNADIVPVALACDSACLAPTGWAPNQLVSIIDLWANASLGIVNVSSGYTAGVPPDGGVVMLKFTPYFNMSLAPDGSQAAAW